jgi:hypothetical protein
MSCAPAYRLPAAIAEFFFCSGGLAESFLEIVAQLVRFLSCPDADDNALFSGVISRIN